MRSLSTLSCILLVGLAASAAHGGFLPEPGPTLVCRLGRVQASTLLLPYFEVHAKKKKADTQVVLQNTSDLPILAHVTLWTDRAVPVLAFDVPLTSLDVVRLSLYDLLFAPAVAPSGVYASICGEPRSELDAACLTLIRSALSGGESVPGSGQCVSWPYGDDRYRGYATVDAVTGGSPGEANLLLGDFELREKKVIFGGPLIHIRADEELPLPSRWAARFENGQAESKRGSPGTELVVWRDLATAGAFPCGTLPPNGDATRILAVDEQASSEELDPGTLLPLSAQRIRVGSSEVPVPYDAGWLSFDLDEPVAPGRSAYVASLVRRPKAALYVEGAPLCMPPAP